jgi:hypothetical protein
MNPNEHALLPQLRPRPVLVVAAWATMLVISDLPDILSKVIVGEVPRWLFWGKTGLLALFLGLTLVWRLIRPLWQYSSVLLVFLLTLGLTSLARDTVWFQAHFNSKGVSFLTGYLALFVLDILAALSVLGALWFIKRDRRAFFLAKGRLDAPIEPVRWLGIKPGESWKRFGWIFAGVAGLAVLIPSMIAIAPSSGLLLRALPFVPAVLLFAAINAFTEEVYFRASILSTLGETIGKTHSLLITAVFFGLAHWLYGSPPGLVGFLMTGFLAWLMGKSMLETKGIAWAWFIHFVPDVVIFATYALLWLKK